MSSKLDTVILAISPSLAHSPTSQSPAALTGSVAGREARFTPLSYAELPAAVKAQLCKLAAQRTLATLFPGTLAPVDLAALPSLLPAMLLRHEGRQAECVIEGHSVGKCPIVPVPGHPERAWALLPDARVAQLKRIPSDNALGCVYIDDARWRGGSGIALNDTPCFTRTVEVEKEETFDKNAMMTSETMTLELPGGLLENAIDSWRAQHSHKTPSLEPEAWRNHVEAALGSMSGFTWVRANHGFAFQANFQPSGNSSVSYTMLVHFKGDSKSTDPNRIPATGRVSLLSLSIEKGVPLVDGKPPRLILDESAWLGNVLKKAGVEMPRLAKLWQQSESGKPVCLDMEMKSRLWKGEIKMADVQLEEDMAAAEDVFQAALDKLSGTDMNHLEKQAFDALTEGGAYCHQPLEGWDDSWCYKFDWEKVAFDVHYQLEEDGHRVSWLSIYCGMAPLVVRGQFDESRMKANDSESEPPSETEDDETEPHLMDDAAWRERIDGLDTLDKTERQEMIAYYRSRDQGGLRELAPNDPYLEQPVKFLRWLRSDKELSVDAFKGKGYEDRRGLAKNYLDANFNQQERTGARGALAPFLVALKPKEGPNDPVNNTTVWSKRISQFEKLNDDNNHKETVIRYYREMHAAGVPETTLRSQSGGFQPFLLHLQAHDKSLSTFLKLDETARAKEIDKFQKDKVARSVITRFVQQIADNVSVPITTKNLPSGEQHLQDLEAFIHWRYPKTVKMTTLKWGTAEYVNKSSFANWMCHLESKNKQARTEVLNSDPKELEKTLGNGNLLIRTVRIYRIWVHMQVHLKESYREASDVHKQAEQRLTDWMFWRKDNIHNCKGSGQRGAPKGQGAWQLLEQLPDMSNDDWDAHVDAYLTGRKIASEEQADARAPLDSFRTWALARRSGKNATQ